MVQMKLNGLFHKLLILLLILIYIQEVRGRLIENVNQAIVENFREEIVSLTNDTADEVETLLDIFSRYYTGSDEIEADNLKEACAASTNISICKEHILKQVRN